MTTQGARVCLCQLWICIFWCEQLSESGLIINMTHAEVFPACRELNASVGWVIAASTRKRSISLLVLPLCLWEWCEAPSHVSKTRCLWRRDATAAWMVALCHKVFDEEFCNETDQELVNRWLEEADGRPKTISFLHLVTFLNNLLV